MSASHSKLLTKIREIISDVYQAEARLNDLGKSYTIGDSTFHYTETDIISSLRRAEEGVKDALRQASELRERPDSVVLQVIRGVRPVKREGAA